MEVVLSALQKPRSDREKYLRATCGDDPEFLKETLLMVKEEEEMGSFLLHPMVTLKEFQRPFQPGEVIAERFQISHEIGEGGMGIVYEAFDQKRGLRIAIKAAKPGFQRLLSPELEGALTVRHPNVCLVNDIYTIDTHPGQLDFLTMELLEGETLAAYLKAHGKLPENEALAIARQLCAGLSEAHRKGVIHRDLKSANVILCRPANGEIRAVITDFGLSGTASDADDLAGTPQYMAPELWQGWKTSKASDIYALGMVLYEMVADPKLETLRDDESWTPDTHGLSKPWANTLLACLSRDPDARPKDASAVLTSLEKRPSLWRYVLALPLLALLALCMPQVRTPLRNRIWPPAAVRLAIIPAAGSDSSLRSSAGILQDVSDRISLLKSGSSLVQVITPAEAKRIRVETPAQARNAHATHALVTSIKPDGADLTVTATLIDMKSQLRIKQLSNRYSPATWGAIPSALAGIVSDGLSLQGSPRAEHLSPAATAPYDAGLQEMSHDDPDASAALSFFAEAARLDPGSPLPLAASVEAEVKKFAQSKDPAFLTRAKEDLHAAEMLNSDSLSVHFAAGFLDEATGDYEKALRQYLRAADLEPASTRAFVRIARMYDKLGMPGKAVASYRAAINLDPNFYKPYEHLGSFYFSHGRYSEAAEQFKHVIERSPEAYLAYTNLGAALQEIHHNSEAEQVLAKGLKIKETANGLNSMGALLASEGREREANSFYARSVVLDPHDYLFFLNLADSNRRLRNFALAKSQYHKGQALTLAELRENPNNGPAWAALAYFSVRLGDRARAQVEIKQALRFAPNNTDVIWLAVMTYEAAGLRDSALDALSGATPQFLRTLDREPDLAGFLRDSRFKNVVASANQGEPK